MAFHQMKSIITNYTLKMLTILRLCKMVNMKNLTADILVQLNRMMMNLMTIRHFDDFKPHIQRIS